MSIFEPQVDLVEQNVAPKMQVYDKKTENGLSTSYDPKEVMKCSNGEEVALGQQIVALFRKQIVSDTINQEMIIVLGRKGRTRPVVDGSICIRVAVTQHWLHSALDIIW